MSAKEAEAPQYYAVRKGKGGFKKCIFNSWICAKEYLEVGVADSEEVVEFSVFAKIEDALQYISGPAARDANRATATEIMAKENQEETDPFLLNMTDIWANNILPFLGPGHFLYMASISRRFKELYLAYITKLKNPPVVGDMATTRQRFTLRDKRKAVPTNTFYSSAFSSVPLAKYWNKITKEEDGRLRDGLVCATVAKHGNLQVLKWARKQGFPWNERTCASAAQGGHLEVLKYAHKEECLWDKWTCAFAAENGQLETLKYAHEKGCEWNEWTCASAAEGGHLKVLKYAHEKGCEWDWLTCARAAQSGHLEVLKYAHEKGCPWNKWTCAYAVRNGHLEVLKYAHEKGCAWDEDTCANAARYGHLEVLKYAHDKECPWDEQTCAYAADNGHFEILKWARQAGCPWDSRTYKWAMEEGHFEIVQWARHNGCPLE